MNIPQNSLVLYKNGPARVAALGDKLDIELEDGRSLRVRPKDVLLLHPGPLRTSHELGEVPAGEVEAACELLDGSQTTLSELAELIYGVYTPSHGLGRLATSGRRAVFSGNAGGDQSAATGGGYAGTDYSRDESG